MIYASYALAFWYGVGLVYDQPENYDPGIMTTVIDENENFRKIFPA